MPDPAAAPRPVPEPHPAPDSAPVPEPAPAPAPESASAPAPGVVPEPALGPGSDTGVSMADDAVGMWCGQGEDSRQGDWTFHPNGYFTVVIGDSVAAEGVAWVGASGTEMHWLTWDGASFVEMRDMAVEIHPGELAGLDIGVGNGDVLYLDGYSYVSCTPR
jgi:hypothetical protein